MICSFTMPEPFPRAAYTDTLAGSIYVESSGVDTYAWVYDRLTEAALGSGESIEVISEIVEEYDE